MSFMLLAAKSRSQSWQGKLYEADGTTPVMLGASDKVRVKIGRGSGATPTLDMVSGTALAGGSSVTIDNVGSSTTPALYTLKLAEGDIGSLVAGPYECEVMVVDAGDSNRVRIVEVGVVSFINQLGGNVGT